jgi:hypothetical protein
MWQLGYDCVLLHVALDVCEYRDIRHSLAHPCNELLQSHPPYVCGVESEGGGLEVELVH